MMKRLMVAIMIILFMCFPAAQAETPSNQLGFALLEQLYVQGEQNVVFSPASLSFALGMASQGAAGQTKEEIDSLIGDGDAAALMAGFTDKGIRIANAVFSADDLSVRESWRSKIEELYDGEVFLLGRQEQLDAWVQEKTGGLLNHAPAVPSENAKLVLMNALAMQMTWKLPFDANSTWDAVFHAPSGDRKIPFMHQTLHAVYGERKAVQLLQLDYAKEHGEVIMLIALPPEGELLNVLSALREEGLSYFSGMKESSRKIKLSMPKTDVTARTYLTDPLQSAGMHISFTNMADFSGISEEPIKIDMIVQDARLQIDEQGTWAAAVTMISMEEGAARPSFEEYVVMDVNRPFIALIVDQEAGAVIFAAVITNPAGT